MPKRVADRRLFAASRSADERAPHAGRRGLRLIASLLVAVAGTGAGFWWLAERGHAPWLGGWFSRPETPPVAEGASPATTDDGELCAQGPLLDRLPGAAGGYLASVAEAVDKLDPARDPAGQIEVFSEQATAELKTLAKQLAHPEELTAASLGPLLTGAFACPPLRPVSRPVYQDAAFTISRPESPPPPADPTAVVHRGANGLVAALRELLTPLPTGGQTRAAFKLFRVEADGQRFDTRVYVEITGTASAAAGQVNAEWRMHWDWPDRNRPPRLARIESLRHEEVGPGARGGLRFVDVTAGVLGENASFREQLVPGGDHWDAQFDVRFSVAQSNVGLSVADLNGDGLEDLFVCQPFGLPNRVYFQQPDGRLLDASTISKLDLLDLTRCALFLDLDGDGDRDGLLVHKLAVSVWANDGTGRFAHQTSIVTTSNLASACAADFDLDGDLDLYVCGYSPEVAQMPGDVFANPVPYHDANNGARNFLIRNEGEFNFRDVTDAVGLNQNNSRFSYAAAWEDIDNDGDPDLFVANDFGRKNLYRNDGGKFQDVAGVAGVEDIGSGMSVSFGDVNHDGWFDVYVGNMFSSAGNRITFQRGFRPGDDEATRAALQRSARGNTLLVNRGDGTFSDDSEPAGVTIGRWAWGSIFVDLNNDGWEDLYVANGFFTRPDPGDL